MNPEYLTSLADYFQPWAMDPLRSPALSADIFHLMELKSRFVPPAETEAASFQKHAGPGGKSIAEIHLRGVLMKGLSWFGGTSMSMAGREVAQAAADPEVGGILLRVDSPGGTVAGTEAMASEIAAASKAKPVFAQVEDTGCSCAYWLASQASQVFAENQTTQVGSIGVYQVIPDTSELSANLGVRMVVVRSAPLKGIGVEGNKLTEEQLAHVQSLVDSAHEVFSDAVMKGRRMSATAFKEVATGGSFRASQAAENGLIDGIQPLKKTMAMLTQEIKGSGRRAEMVQGGFAPPVRGGFQSLTKVS